MTIQLKRHDRAAALRALCQGEYEAITTSSQGALDELVYLAIEMGVFEALEVIQVKRERAGIPDELLLRALAVLPFVEAMVRQAHHAIGLSAATGCLFQDAAILLQIGFSIQQIQKGFNERHHGESSKADTSKPCHPEVLRQELARVDLDSLASFRRTAIQPLFERRLVKLKDRYCLVGILNVHRDRALWLNWRLLESGASEKGEEARIVRDMVNA